MACTVEGCTAGAPGTSAEMGERGWRGTMRAVRASPRWRRGPVPVWCVAGAMLRSDGGEQTLHRKRDALTRLRTRPREICQPGLGTLFPPPAFLSQPYNVSSSRRNAGVDRERAGQEREVMARRKVLVQGGGRMREPGGGVGGWGLGAGVGRAETRLFDQRILDGDPILRLVLSARRLRQSAGTGPRTASSEGDPRDRLQVPPPSPDTGVAVRSRDKASQ